MYRATPVVVTIKLRFADSTKGALALQLALRVLGKLLRPDKSSKTDTMRPVEPKVIEVSLSDKTQLYYPNR